MRTESDPGFGIILEVKFYLFFPLFPQFYLLKQKTLQKSTKKVLIFANPGVQLHNLIANADPDSGKPIQCRSRTLPDPDQDSTKIDVKHWLKSFKTYQEILTVIEAY
jgi:hypothetical protein